MNNFSSPYLIFLGDLQDRVNAKTGQGLVDWCPEKCLAQLRLPTCTIDLGLPDMTIQQAKQAGARSMIIGIAPVGGRIKQEWIPLFEECLRSSIDIINGLHTRLDEIPALTKALKSSLAEIVHLRTPPENLVIGTGAKRKGKRVLTIGTDCGVGKKYTALSLHRTLESRGVKSTFRATGQTGIMISGSGIPIDSVVVDFVSGAAEMLSPDNDLDHWDVIEGQGALHHPGYAAVSLGLLHGSQPDAIVLCHEASRHELGGFPGYAIGSLRQRVDEALLLAKMTNPEVRCAGISVNTAWLTDSSGQDYLRMLSHETQLPCVDPLAGDLSPIVDNLLMQS